MHSHPLEYAEFEEVRFPRSSQMIREGFATGVATAFAYGVWMDGRPEQAYVGAFGQTALPPEGRAVHPRTVFDIASISKVYGAATLAAQLVDRGWLSWETPVAALIQGYKYPAIKLRHLLAHTAGFPAWEPLWQRMRDKFEGRELWSVPIEERQEAMRSLVLSIRPEVPPDTRVLYSDITFLTLGFLLEELTGMSLNVAVERLLWRRLGVVDSFYRPVNEPVEKARLKDIAATERCPWRGGTLQGQVHDDNCWTMGGYAGHAGAFSTVPDLLHYSRRLLKGFLSDRVMKAIWSRAPLPVGCTRTLGWDTPTGEQSTVGPDFSPRSVGHLGFTGTSLWIDPDHRLAVCLLTNRVHPTRDNPKIQDFRRAFHRALAFDLGLHRG
jgi:CubicO group peptidase (beta-lactamase class C family)